MNFEGKVIMVTGAAGGIGKEVVRKLADHKRKLYFGDLNEDAIKAVQTELN